MIIQISVKRSRPPSSVKAAGKPEVHAAGQAVPQAARPAWLYQEQCECPFCGRTVRSLAAHQKTCGAL